MFFNELDYLKMPVLSGDLVKDATEIFVLNGKMATLEHSVRVAQMCEKLAYIHGIDTEKAYLCGILHDISAVVLQKDFVEIAKNYKLKLLDDEKKFPILAHQKISKLMCEKIFGIKDEEICAAAGCHTTLRGFAGKYDLVLFISDKIEWDKDDRADYYDDLLRICNVSLEMACLTYINYVLDNNMLLVAHADLLMAKRWLERLI